MGGRGRGKAQRVWGGGNLRVREGEGEEYGGDDRKIRGGGVLRKYLENKGAENKRRV